MAKPGLPAAPPPALPVTVPSPPPHAASNHATAAARSRTPAAPRPPRNNVLPPPPPPRRYPNGVTVHTFPDHLGPEGGGKHRLHSSEHSQSSRRQRGGPHGSERNPPGELVPALRIERARRGQTADGHTRV